MLNIEYLGRVCVSLLALVVFVGGCTPYATYPPVGKGEVAVPWMHPIPDVMGKALGATYERTSDAFVSDASAVDLVYGLPAGITTGVWTRVGIDTGVPNARMLTAEDVTAGTPAWLVEQVRIRNKRAEVDVVYPTPGESHMRATVIFEAQPFGPYKMTHFQRWESRIDDPVYSLPVDLPTEAEPEVGASEPTAEPTAEPTGELAEDVDAAPDADKQ